MRVSDAQARAYAEEGRRLCLIELWNTLDHEPPGPIWCRCEKHDPAKWTEFDRRWGKH